MVYDQVYSKEQAMNTARERYEAKTKVVTFRVSQELYAEIKRVQAESGLSFADLVKLGAGIAREEIEDKIEEIHNLQGKLAQLREEEQAGKQTVADMIEKEKQAQHQKLERELEIFRLFDRGWSIEEVDFKLRLGRREISKYFNEWAEMRGEREKLQEELLKKCLYNYIWGCCRTRPR
jgi:vacuolar-type H+-ATPase subunit I/STV1